MGWVAWGVYYKCIIMGGGVAGICIACVPTTGSIGGSPTRANIDSSLELFSTSKGEGRCVYLLGSIGNIDESRNGDFFAGDENVERVSYVSRDDAD